MCGRQIGGVTFRSFFRLGCGLSQERLCSLIKKFDVDVSQDAVSKFHAGYPVVVCTEEHRVILGQKKVGLVVVVEAWVEVKWGVFAGGVVGRTGDERRISILSILSRGRGGASAEKKCGYCHPQRFRNERGHERRFLH